MLLLLIWVPIATSAILGVFYLFENTQPARKILGVLVFLSAVYFQFFSPYFLAGLLLQVALAVCLALWRKAAA